MPTLKEQIFRYLSDLVVAGAHNDLLPSQNQLRERFNAGMVTVRSAFDRLEAEGMIYRIQGKGCFIRKVENTRADVRIFLILPLKADVKGEFVSGLFTAARSRGYHVMFFNYNGSVVDLSHEINAFGPNVIIWVAPEISRESETIAKLTELNAHLILFNREYQHPRVNFVTGNFYRDGEVLAEKLLPDHPRRILYVGRDMEASFSRQRFEGFRDGLLKGGFSPEELETIDFSAREYECGALTGAVRTALAGSRFDLVVSSQGALWQDIAAALREAGCDTNTMSFANFNALEPGDPLSGRSTLIVQPIETMGALAIDAAAKLLAGEERQITMRVPAEFLPAPV